MAEHYVHPRALCESEEVGGGSRIWAFAQVMKGAKIGKNCNIGGHSFVEGGAIIGNGVTVKNGVLIWEGINIEDGVFIGPNVLFTNDRYPRSPRCDHLKVAERYQEKSRWLVQTTIKKGASLGAGAIIGPGVTVGEFATIGAGAVVTKNVAPKTLVVGNPARPIGLVCECGIPYKEPNLGSSCDCGATP